MTDVHKKFDGIMKGFIQQKNKLQGLKNQVIAETEQQLKIMNDAEVRSLALNGLQYRIDNSIGEINKIIGESSDV